MIQCYHEGDHTPVCNTDGYMTDSTKEVICPEVPRSTDNNYHHIDIPHIGFISDDMFV